MSDLTRIYTQKSIRFSPNMELKCFELLFRLSPHVEFIFLNIQFPKFSTTLYINLNFKNIEFRKPYATTADKQTDKKTSLIKVKR